MNTESLTPPPFLAGNIREAMYYRGGNCTVMACTMGGMGTKTGFLLPARRTNAELVADISIWPVAKGRGLGFLGYDPSESGGESGCEHYEN